MKKLALLMFMALAGLTLTAKNYFEVGTTWVDKIILNDHNVRFATYHLQTPSNGETGYLELWQADGYQSLSVPVAKAYVKVEGDKVYFRLLNSEIKDWFLGYDFGLKAGEGALCYSPNFLLDDGKPLGGYYKCVETLESNPSYGGLPTLSLQLFKNQDDVQPVIDDVTWLSGIGGTGGLFRAYEGVLLGLDGGAGGELFEVRNGDEIIYQSQGANYTCFVPGTEWTSKVRLESGNLVTQKVWIEESSEPARVGNPLMVSDDGADGSLVAYVWEEGYRVYFSLPDAPGTAYLMYDFKPGAADYFEVCSPINLDADGKPLGSDTKFIGYVNNSGSDKVEQIELVQTNGTDKQSAFWLTGIGDTRGVLHNYLGAPATASYLVEVKQDGKTVYQAPADAEVKALSQEAPLVTVEGTALNIRNASQSEGSIYSIDGKLLKRFPIASGEATVELSPGTVYIVRLSNHAYKVSL